MEKKKRNKKNTASGGKKAASIRKQPVEMTEEEFNHLLRKYSESRTRLKF